MIFPLEDLVSRSSIKVKWEKQLEKEGKEGRCNIRFLCYNKNDKSQNVCELGNDPTEKALGIEIFRDTFFEWSFGMKVLREVTKGSISKAQKIILS